VHSSISLGCFFGVLEVLAFCRTIADFPAPANGRRNAANPHNLHVMSWIACDVPEALYAPNGKGAQIA
jgi:hypothetical protein